MFEKLSSEFQILLKEVATLDTGIILLISLIAMGIILYDRFDMVARKKRKSSGITHPLAAIVVDGSQTLSTRQYVSEIQGLAGRPDAVILENGNLIPVERKPLARKIRDRYVAQLLVYMRLIEEFEGKRPPYGYLLLGPKAKRVRIHNTPARQRWLQTMLDDMRFILEGNSARPDPSERKCAKCSVRSYCAFSQAAFQNEISAQSGNKH